MSSLFSALESIKQTDKTIFVCVISGREVVFCLPSIKKAIQYQKLLNMADNQDESNEIVDFVFRSIVVNQELLHLEDLPAGIPFTTVQLCFYFNGLLDRINMSNSLLNDRRNELSDILVFMKRVICHVFHGYKFEDIDRLSYPEIIEIFVNAEQILVEQGIIEEENRLVITNGPVKEKQISIEEQIKRDAQEMAGRGPQETSQSFYDQPHIQEKLRRIQNRQLM